jgi:uncharacterized membrane protein YbhN (UPF0104 family)
MNKAFLFFIAKISVTAWIVYILVNAIDFEHVSVALQKVPYSYIAISVSLSVFAVWMTAYRWRLIISCNQETISSWHTFYYTMIGAFLNQCLPSSIGGDVYRGFMLKQQGLSTSSALNSTLIDRLYGLSSFVILATIGCLFEWKILITTFLGEIMLLTIGLIFAGLGGLLSLKWMESFLPSMLRPFITLSKAVWTTFTQGKKSLLILLVSLITALCIVVGAEMLALGIGLNLSLSQAFIAIPLAILVSAIPLSFAGWGLREGAMVVILSAYGISKEEALALSLLFGMSQILASLPGLALWCFSRQSQKIFNNANSLP